MMTVSKDLPKQMARVRATMPAYRDIGPLGIVALRLMHVDLDRAAKAIAEGDLPAMISAYKALKDYKS